MGQRSCAERQDVGEEIKLGGDDARALSKDPQPAEPQQSEQEEGPGSKETSRPVAVSEQDPGPVSPVSPTPAGPAQKPSSWTDEEALAWAMSTGLKSDVQAKMKEERVDGNVLLRLDHEGWRVLGVGCPLQAAKLQLALEEMEEEEKEHVGVVKPPPPGLLFRIPLVNLFLDFVGETPPDDLDEVRTTLDVLGLLGALFLTVSMALPSAVQYSEVTDAIRRLDEPPYSGAIGSGTSISKDFVIADAVSVLGLGSSLISTVILHVSMTLTRDNIFGNKEVKSRWWRYCRWVLLWDIIAVVVGITSCFFGFNRMVFLKLPDFLVERTGDWSWLSRDSTFGLYRGAGLVTLIGTLIFAFACASWAKFRTSFIF